MTQYIKKPLPIEAFRLVTRTEAPEWFIEAILNGIVQPIEPIENESYKIHGHDGNPNGGFAEIGDYIIKGIKGEIYTCQADIFEASYDSVVEVNKNTQESPFIEFDYSAEVIELIVETVNKINFHHDNDFKNKLIRALGGTITADCAA